LAHPVYAGSLEALQVARPEAVGLATDSAGEKDFIFLLTKGNYRALALWTTDADHAVTLALGASERTLIHVLGRSKRISCQPDQLKLTVSGSPQYLLITD
jgi:hypothetical protein